MISARLRDGIGWNDARILNMSSRGLLLHARQAPGRGSYVEISRGAHRIVGRVVWVGKDRFGVRTQDRIPADVISVGADAPAAKTQAPNVAGRPPARTGPDRMERSRRRASAMQFLWVASFGVAAATVAFDAIKAALSRPLSEVSAQLAGKR